MNCRCSCEYASIIGSIIAGVVLGILYALGFVSLGVVFWVYLLVGILGVLLAPIYSACAGRRDMCSCRTPRAGVVSGLITIALSAVGLILAPVASTVVLAIVLGVTTAFAATVILSSACCALGACRD